MPLFIVMLFALLSIDALYASDTTMPIDPYQTVFIGSQAGHPNLNLASPPESDKPLAEVDPATGRPKTAGHQPNHQHATPSKSALKKPRPGDSSPKTVRFDLPPEEEKSTVTTSAVHRGLLPLMTGSMSAVLISVITYRALLQEIKLTKEQYAQLALQRTTDPSVDAALRATHSKLNHLKRTLALKVISFGIGGGLITSGLNWGYNRLKNK